MFARTVAKRWEEKRVFFELNLTPFLQHSNLLGSTNPTSGNVKTEKTIKQYLLPSVLNKHVERRKAGYTVQNLDIDQGPGRFVPRRRTIRERHSNCTIELHY